MEFLYILENIRCPFLDAVMSVITNLGSEAFFMVAALILYWCIDKKHGYYILAAGFLGTIINQFLKLVCRVPRPWVKDPDFTIVESARAGATGYSFPSGHTQNAASYLGSIARIVKKSFWRVLLVVLILLTAFSRMYLGVHTPADVLVSLIIGAVLVFALYPLFMKCNSSPKLMYIILTSMFLIAALYTAFAELHMWPSDIDPDNLAEGIKNGWSLTGASAGMLLAYFFDSRYIRFKVRAPLPAQLIKVVFGLGLTLVIKSALKAPLLALFNFHSAAHGVRYFIMVVFAACVWPLTFPYISAIFKKR